MKIIIAGAGDVGFHLAKLLSYESQDTYVIDFDGEKLDYINSHLDVITKKGDATSIKLLKEIGIESTDILLAVIKAQRLRPQRRIAAQWPVLLWPIMLSAR